MRSSLTPVIIRHSENCTPEGALLVTILGPLHRFARAAVALIAGLLCCHRRRGSAAQPPSLLFLEVASESIGDRAIPIAHGFTEGRVRADASAVLTIGSEIDRAARLLAEVHEVVVKRSSRGVATRSGTGGAVQHLTQAVIVDLMSELTPVRLPVRLRFLAGKQKAQAEEAKLIHVIARQPLLAIA